MSSANEEKEKGQASEDTSTCQYSFDLSTFSQESNKDDILYLGSASWFSTVWCCDQDCDIQLKTPDDEVSLLFKRMTNQHDQSTNAASETKNDSNDNMERLRL